MAKRKKALWDPSKRPAANARLALPRLAAKYLKAGESLLLGKPSPAELHQFRLRTKRLRYTLELFDRCYERGLESRLEALRKIQQHLGDLSDCQASRRLLLDTRKPRPEEGPQISALLKRRVAETKAELLQHLQDTLHGPGRRRWWVDYLAGRSGSGSRAASEAS
jgi:CHAD domain-containing protein